MKYLSECLNCGREAEEPFSSNFFVVHTCPEDGQKYCDECSDCGNCLSYGSSCYTDYDKVYTR